ncbi:MAG: hypothetical protein ACLF0P_14875 [Thermoanaerobaculia bacterium]
MDRPSASSGHSARRPTPPVPAPAPAAAGTPASAAPALALLLGVAGTLAAPGPAPAQDPGTPPDTQRETGEAVQEIDGMEDRRLLWGVRLGGFEMINAEDSYDAVFDDPMPMLGVQLDWRWRQRWVLEATLDYGEVDGERVLLADPPVGTGVDETLTYVPVHLTASWSFYHFDPWELRAGAGPSLLWWEDESGGELAGVDASDDGTELGANAALSLRRAFTAWTLGGELRWSTFPDAVGDAGVTEFFDEDDPGGVSVHVIALWGR